MFCIYYFAGRDADEQLIIQYIKREYKIYAVYKELPLGQGTVYMPPPPNQSRACLFTNG